MHMPGTLLRTCYVSIKIITRTQTTASKFRFSIKELRMDWMNNGSSDAKTPNPDR